MKRGIILTIIIVACIAGFLSIRGTMPFMPIFGSSMEPALKSGNLLVIKPMNPNKVEVGDIIVYNVPKLVRDYYNYPPVVAHRVIKINTVPRLTFRTAGDNTGEDPFTIMPGDLRGTVGDQIPFLGLPLLFLQSTQGLIFTAVALALLAFFLYNGELSHTGRLLQRGIFAPAIQETRRTNQVLTRKIEHSEQKMESTEQALEKFAAAIAEYAQHLASHTSAIKGLAEASHELKKSSAEQNRVLMQMMERMGQLEATKPQPEATTVEKEPEAPQQKKSFPPGCVRNRQQPSEKDNSRNAHPKKRQV